MSQPRKDPRLSPTQAETLAYFAGPHQHQLWRAQHDMPRDDMPRGGSGGQTTRRVLIRLGLLEATDTWPYHQATDAGRQLIDRLLGLTGDPS
jgi:hypothetical protein